MTPLRQVVGNRDLRRLLLAWAAAMTGEYALATAVAVFAYRIGGAAAVAAYVVVRLALVAITLPFSGLLIDRLGQRRFLVGADVARLATVGAAAAVVLVGGPPVAVLVLAALATVVGAPSRPAQAALVPSLARTPQEVTAANAVGATAEGLAYFLGPALAGVLLLGSGVAAVLLLDALMLGASVLFLLRLPAPAARPRPVGSPRPRGPRVGGAVTAGFRAIAADRRLALVGALACTQTVLSGAGLVFVVAVAGELAGLGGPGVGYLGSVLGAGALLGGLATLGRSARGRVARDFGGGVLLWAVAPLLMAAWPATLPAFLAFALMGVGNALVDVNTLTLVQRLAPAALLSRVLVALETALMATMAMGALVMPALLTGLGLRWALVAVSGPIVLAGLIALPATRRLDRTVSAPADLDLVAGQPLFAALAPPAQEALARRLITVRVRAGTEVVRQGDVGDLFYLIRTGRLDALQGTRRLSTMTAGDCFGEIALLRDVSRTATVVAREDCILAALERRDFLAVLSTSPRAATVAEDLVARRLG